MPSPPAGKARLEARFRGECNTDKPDRLGHASSRHAAAGDLRAALRFGGFRPPGNPIGAAPATIAEWRVNNTDALAAAAGFLPTVFNRSPAIVRRSIMPEERR
jgi:hypothetical protein